MLHYLKDGYYNQDSSALLCNLLMRDAEKCYSRFCVGGQKNPFIIFYFFVYKPHYRETSHKHQLCFLEVEHAPLAKGKG